MTNHLEPRQKNKDRRTAIVDQLLDEQIRYYRERTPEYDEWFFRQGRYNCGPEQTRLWFKEVEEVRRSLNASKPTGHVLELACGTGLWTEQLTPHAAQVTAVDSSPEAIELNRRRVKSNHVEYQLANLFEWSPNARYDFVFFGFWLSHVPPSRFITFWNLVRNCLAPGGRVFFVDSRHHPAATSKGQSPVDPTAVRSRRRLNDGREFDIVKIFYKPEELKLQLSSLGWLATVHETANFFVYGSVAT